MTTEVLLIRARGMSPVAEWNDPANVATKQMIRQWNYTTENHILVTVDSEDANIFMERINTFDSVIRAYTL